MFSWNLNWQIISCIKYLSPPTINSKSPTLSPPFIHSLSLIFSMKMEEQTREELNITKRKEKKHVQVALGLNYLLFRLLNIYTSLWFLYIAAVAAASIQNIFQPFVLLFFIIFWFFFHFRISAILCLSILVTDDPSRCLNERAC